MQFWLESLSGILLLILLLGLPGAWRRRQERQRREAQRRLELVLLPRESVKVICHQKGGQYILTSRRVLLETPQGFTALPIRTIHKLQGSKKDGTPTSKPEEMTTLTIQGEVTLTLRSTCPEFPEFVRTLQKRTEKKPKKRGKLS